jgi:hypothetical protein
MPCEHPELSKLELPARVIASAITSVQDDCRVLPWYVAADFGTYVIPLK